MKKIFLASLAIFLFCNAFSQIIPTRLKYFGFAIVDCGHDDPNDLPTTTNYITEVDTFSNVAQMCIRLYTDTIISRVNLMNSLCVKPILSISRIFIYRKDSLGPSGSNYDLRPDYLSRWNTFKATNASVLTASNIETFYVCDEPTWNGVSFGALDTICSQVKSDFPNIPITFVEAYTMVDSLQVPATADWIGFDRYGVYDVSTDSTYLSELAILESKRSTPNQKIILVFDDQWNSGFWPANWQPDTIEHVVQHYLDLAVADTNIIGMVGFTWPGLSPGWLGARSMPQNVIDKTVQIGEKIKANYSPCNMSGIEGNEEAENYFKTYPNPVAEKLNILSSYGKKGFVRIFSALGSKVQEIEMRDVLTTVTLSNLSPGLYFYQISDTNGSPIESGKFMKK